MSSSDDSLFERLGPAGLSRVLGDLLDRPRLVRLANACGLEYPGMRTRSQTRGRVLDDLVQRAREHGPTRKAILRTLSKETRKAAREWKSLGEDERAARLGDPSFLLSKGNLGLHLFLVAGSGDNGSTPQIRDLIALASDGRPAAAETARTSPEAARQVKLVGRLEKKVRHLEVQLAKVRESEKAAKRELSERKEDLAEARAQLERLGKELAASATRPSTQSPDSEEVAKLGRGLRRLATAQRKLSAGLDKLPESLGRVVRSEPASRDPLFDGIKGLAKELASMRRERSQETKEISARIDELGGLLRAQRPGKAASARRRPGKGDRVGVFIDVQNMYYSARQLKGKLDFDALLQAAVLDRRLIHATAYVVESKEIDQSGFIALLQQRGIEVRRKTLRVRGDGSMKGDWDMELALDILDGALDLDVVVLVSGDGDFTSLVKRVKKMGPRVEVIGFPRTTAKSLLGAADRFQPLDRKFMIYTRKRARKPSAEPGSTGG